MATWLSLPNPIPDMDRVIRPDPEFREEVDSEGRLFNYRDPFANFVTLSSNVTKIGKEAFKNCPYLCTVIVPDTVTVIELDAFKGSSVKKVSVSRDTILEGGYEGVFNECQLAIEVRYAAGTRCVVRRDYRKENEYES